MRSLAAACQELIALGALETAELMLKEDLGIESHRCADDWHYDPLKKLKAKIEGHG